MSCKGDGDGIASARRTVSTNGTNDCGNTKALNRVRLRGCECIASATRTTRTTRSA